MVGRAVRGAGARRGGHVARAASDAIETVHAVRLEAHLGELAHHFLQAAPDGETQKAVEYATRAAELALAQLAPHEAVGYFDKFSSSSSPRTGRSTRAGVVMCSSHWAMRSGTPGIARLIRPCSAPPGSRSGLADSERLARAALTSRTRTFAAGRGDHRRVAMLDAALVAVGEEDTPVRARVLAALAGAGVRRRGRFDLSDEALTITHRVGDSRTLVEVLEQRLHSNRRSSNLAERLVLGAQAAELAQQLADPALSASAVAWQGCGPRGRRANAARPTVSSICSAA